MSDAELERFGGTVESLVGGTVAAVFGVPIAHEDDPERAVRAALACRDVVTDAGRRPHRELHYEVRIGDRYGRGSGRRRRRTVMGEAEHG